jgi:pyroglutamyl-peptidase
MIPQALKKGIKMKLLSAKSGSVIVSALICSMLLGIDKAPDKKIIVALPKTYEQPYKVLLTSFDPFGGSSKNNTQPIVAQLAQMASALGPNIQVVTCNLPVVYDQGAATATDCIQKNQPDAVVSFGEADCSLQIETAATNLDDTPGGPDNAGNIRQDSPIIPGGPDRSGFNFPVESMFCGLSSSSQPVVVSMSPGGFVCNNVAYHLSQELNAKKIPFTFIHVPNSQCPLPQGDPSTSVSTIVQMLNAGFAGLRAAGPANPYWPHPSNSVLLPTTADTVTQLLSQLNSTQAPSCEIDFLNQLSDAYQSGV